jgi:ATP-grasp domain, R2K clade family 3
LEKRLMHSFGVQMKRTTLVLSTHSLPASQSLAEAARRRGWHIISLDRPVALPAKTVEIVFYGSTLVAMEAAERLGLALLEPPLDLLARLPPALLLRGVEFHRWGDLQRLPRQLFVKPADPLAKLFDAGVYSAREQIRTATPIPTETPVLIADPVEWLAEYRCFVLDRQVVATSPYLSFGRPLHHGENKAFATPPPVQEVCRRLLALPELPPAFVVDVGLIEERGWAVVEFNPAWCSGLLSADPARVLDVLKRSCISRRALSHEDRRWVRNG